jgi:hypothetical protein
MPQMRTVPIPLLSAIVGCPIRFATMDGTDARQPGKDRPAACRAQGVSAIRSRISVFGRQLSPSARHHRRRSTLHVVLDVSYAGDEGGIVCHIVPSGNREALVVSLTQVWVPRSMPFAAAVADYHKHRVKNLKKQTRV